MWSLQILLCTKKALVIQGCQLPDAPCACFGVVVVFGFVSCKKKSVYGPPNRGKLGFPALKWKLLM